MDTPQYHSTHSVHVSPPPLSAQAMNDLLYTIVLLCRGKDKYNRDFWAYMCIKPSMAEAFKKARDSGKLNLIDFGTILEAGEGTEPPEDIRQQMERNYGAKHDYEELLLKAIDAMKRKSEG